MRIGLPFAGLVLAGCVMNGCRPVELAEHSDSPPATVVSRGVCPFEGCQYGVWVVREPVAVYSAPDGAQLSTPLPAGATITAITGEVHSTPRRAIVTHTYASDERQGISVGDVVYPLYPLGEGAMAVWHRGTVKAGSLDLAFRYDDPNRRSDWTWWVHARLAEGRVVWLRDPRGFSGMDALS
jgi:hypothetical protein